LAGLFERIRLHCSEAAMSRIFYGKSFPPAK